MRLAEQWQLTADLRDLLAHSERAELPLSEGERRILAACFAIVAANGACSHALDLRERTFFCLNPGLAFCETCALDIDGAVFLMAPWHGRCVLCVEAEPATNVWLNWGSQLAVTGSVCGGCSASLLEGEV